MRTGDLVEIDVRGGCYCNTLTCVHQFRLWSRLWYLGVRRRMPIALKHPCYEFKVKT